MASLLGKLVQIKWGASFANSWDVGYPVDEPLTYSQPASGSEHVVAPSGDRDAWIIRHVQMLEVSIRWIPGAITTNPTATGWEGATGVRAALEWLKDGNIGRWYGDRVGAPTTFSEFYLVEAIEMLPLSERDATQTLRLKMEKVDGTEWTGYVRQF